MIEIKPVVLDQIVSLQQISRQTFLDTFGDSNNDDDMQKHLDHAYSIEKLTSEWKNPNSFFFFAWRKQSICAYLKVNIDDAQTENIASNAAEIERIYVKKEFKRQGIGKLLFEQASSVAKQHQKDNLWLGVWEKNYSALEFYKQLGFAPIDEHIFTLGNSQQRDLIMQKQL